VVARSDDEREVPESDDLEIPADSDSLPLEPSRPTCWSRRGPNRSTEDEYR